MIASTDSNINHPLQSNQIDIGKHLYENLKDIIDPIPIYGRKEFDLIKVKDPNTIYYVKENEKINTYLGELLLPKRIEKNKVSSKFCLMINDKNEYCIYRLNISNKFNEEFNYILLCKYKKAQDAINKLSELRKIGSIKELNRELYGILISHLNHNVNMNDTIFGIMILYGLGDHISFQPTVSLVNHYKNQMKNLETYFRLIHDIVYDKRGNIPILFNTYYQLFKIWVKYDYFKDKKYKIENLDNIILKDEINDIVEVMKEYE